MAIRGLGLTPDWVLSGINAGGNLGADVHISGTVAAVREAGGPGLGIGIDFHGRVHKTMAKVLAKELESYRPMFIEEPVLPQNNEALREIARYTSIPIATGERMFSRWDFKQLLIDGYVDIIQPDLSHAGGITECKKIISMAEAFDVAAAPHCPLGPIALAASVQRDLVERRRWVSEADYVEGLAFAQAFTTIKRMICLIT